MLRKGSAIAAAVAAAIALSVARPPGVSADQGVRIDAGRISLDANVLPGNTYHLPSLGVSDPGNQGASYSMHVGILEGAKVAEASWFEFSPATFTLNPGQTQRVAVTLRIPTSAQPGDYTALLSAQIGAGTGPGVGIGAAAGSRLTFTVAPSSDLAALLNLFGSWFADNRIWLLPLVAVLALLLASRFVRRRVTIEVRRR